MALHDPAASGFADPVGSATGTNTTLQSPYQE